jgi:hypothetical protein
MSPRRHEWCGSYAIPAADFSVATVGSKSLNLCQLQVTVCLSACLSVHLSVCLPVGSKSLNLGQLQLSVCLSACLSVHLSVCLPVGSKSLNLRQLQLSVCLSDPSRSTWVSRR